MNNHSPSREMAVDYLKTFHQFPDYWLNTPLSAFGGKSPEEYAKEHGWEYVMATLRRIFQ